MNLQLVRELSDGELLAQVQQLARKERQSTATLVAHLCEMERRKLYLQEGCRSLFTYCVQVLHLSEYEAYGRIEAARVALRFPAALTHLAAGDVHLTAVSLLGPLLTPANHTELLDAAKHKSKREIEALIARLHPRPEVAASVRKLPATVRPVAGVAGNTTTAGPSDQAGIMPPAAEPDAGRGEGETRGAGHGEPDLGHSHSGAAGEGRRVQRAPGIQRPAAQVVPLAPQRYKVQFTATADTRDKLRRAQELLRHRFPDGDVAAVIDQALDLLVRDLERKKFAATERPRRADPATRVAEGATASGGGATEPSQPRSRYIPAATKRAVWERDGGRCTFVGRSGLRCAERGQLEFDHLHPHADGGDATVENLRLLCRRHNQHAAELFFGLWRAELLPGPDSRAAGTP